MTTRITAQRLVLPVLALTATALPYRPADATESAEVFARIGDDTVISRSEFEREVWATARETFYHGRPPSGDALIEFRRDVAQRLIDRHLLLIEANRRDLEPDHAAIDAEIAAYETRYANTERWRREGERMKAALRERFEQDSILEALEAQVRETGDPTQAALKEFYDANPDLFTEPARNRVQLILLGVAPSSTAPVWEAAREEAARIRYRVENGASFDELARLHSSDPTAGNGGDMGYMHIGMLSSNAEAAIAELDIGKVSEPVTVLEGVALFRLTERLPPEQHAFADVESRAEDLWRRAESETHWNELLAELRSGSEVSVDNTYLASLPGSAD